MVLADVFENVRHVPIYIQFRPFYYYTAPGFSFDHMLKYTKVKLELLSENSIHDGLTQASMIYARANNEKNPRS